MTMASLEHHRGTANWICSHETGAEAVSSHFCLFFFFFTAQILCAPHGEENTFYPMKQLPLSCNCKALLP